MNVFFLLPFVAGSFSLLLAAISLLRKKPTPAAWCFFAGMTALGLDSIFTGLSLRAVQLGDVFGWLMPAFIAKTFIPVIWLSFSLTYSRTNYRDFLASWKIPLLLLAILPIGLSLVIAAQTFWVDSLDPLWWLQPGPSSTALNAVFLVALVLIVTNLEQTFRAAVGTMRWRIKLVVLGLGVVFAARLYVRIQAMLFSAPDIALWSIESGGLLVGCILLTLAYTRTRWTESDVYPSSAVLRSSLTVLIVGGYLFVIGVVAQLVKRFGGADLFQFQAIVVLVGMAGLAMLLLSDRARHTVHQFIARHFKRAQHDSAQIWTSFSEQLAAVRDQEGLCSVSGKLIAETFEALSVTIWLVDEESGRLTVAASTSPQASRTTDIVGANSTSDAIAGLESQAAPFDLDHVPERWAEELRQTSQKTFDGGGARLCVPLRCGSQILGAVVLADRVGGAAYSVEETKILECIGNQVTSVLLNLRLSGEVAKARELEAFRTMSAFFVHDLKNAASSLKLMLQNLPVHFDDPAFRQDALRGIGNVTGRIEDMITRLTALRERPDALRVETDLNQIVSDALSRVNGTPNVELTRELQPLPGIVADREQMQSVVTNLVLNAKDAVASGGTIRVRTEADGDRVILAVSDNGCGMTQAFVQESLFRPFHSTKKKGLGIGLFQSRAIVQAHGGRIQVETAPGKGTTFVVSLPAVHQP